MPTCRNCHKGFDISDRDLKYYEKIKVPEPTHCPACRLQRRIATRNEHHFYKRRSDFSGKNIISIYSPEKPFKIYEYEEWWSDSWNALDFGREIDWGKSFFEQYAELMKKVPRIALQNEARNENCPYINLATENRNCYLIMASNSNEDVYYSLYTNSCKNSMDNLFIRNCEVSYECVDSERLFQCAYVFSSEQCSDSLFLYDCQACSNCIGCVGLRHQQNSWLNEKLSAEEFRKRKEALLREGRPALERLRREWEKLVLEHPRLFIHGRHNENCHGDYIYHSKNSFQCFDVTHLEDCSYCIWLHDAKDCYDHFAFGRPAERCYECQTAGDNAYNIKFSFDCWTNVANLEYCSLCVGSQDCFGCIGLKRNRYCILNKQYSEKEYETVAQKLKEHMKRTGEYGEFFPIPLSPFAYNETVAQEFFPLMKDEAISRGYGWLEEEIKDISEATASVPATILETPDHITNEVLSCTECQKNYRIIPQELRLYRILNLPLPLKCFQCRLADRKKLRNPRKLWKRPCQKCSAPVETSYAPDRPEKVYCEQCYLQMVY